MCDAALTQATGRSAPSEAPAGAHAGLSGASTAGLVTAVAHLERSVAVAEEAGRDAEAARAGQALAFLKVLALGRAALGAMEDAAVAARTGADAVLAIDAQAALGRAYLLVGNPAAAHEQFTASLVAARSRRDREGLTHAHIGLGRARVALGRYVDADASLQQGLDLAGRVGERHAEAVALVGLGESARVRGEATGSRDFLSRAAEMARANDHVYPLGLALVGLGRLGLDEGDAEAAQSNFEEALATARAGCLPYLLVPSLCGLAALASHPSTAESMLGEALSAAQRWGDWSGEALAFEQSARLSRAQGDLRRAAVRHRHALSLRLRVGDPAAIATSLEAIAHLCAAEDDPAVSARLLAAAETLRTCHGCARPRSAVAEHEGALESVRGVLGDQRFDAEWRQGAAMSIRSAVSLANEHRG